MGFKKDLENFSRGPGKSCKSPGFFVSKRVGTLLDIIVVIDYVAAAECGW